MNEKIRIAVRVDGDTYTGMGHVVECLSLARSLRQRADCEILFLTKENTPGASKIDSSGDEMMLLPKQLEQEEEIHHIQQHLEAWHPRVLIANLRHIDDFYLRPFTKPDLLSVVIRDTIEHRRLYANMVLNYHLGQKESFYLVDPAVTTLCYIGPEYVLLNEAFYQEWLMERPVSEKCDSILVNQGGSDPYGLTAKILLAIDALCLSQTVFVVVGSALSEQHRAELDDLATRLRGRYVFKHDISNRNMMSLMRDADLAITAAGNTLYELAVMGVPSIVLCHHENHNVVADLFAKKGAVINLGIGGQIPERLIAEAVESLLCDVEKRRLLRTNAKHILDGRGAARVAEAILSRVSAT